MKTMTITVEDGAKKATRSFSLEPILKLSRPDQGQGFIATMTELSLELDKQVAAPAAPIPEVKPVEDTPAAKDPTAHQFKKAVK